MAHVYVRSGAGGAGTGADWTNAYTTLAAAFAAKAAGDQFWIADDHAETQGSTMTLTSPGTAAAPCTACCVNRAGSVPPVSADLRTTATITTTGNFALTISTGYTYWYGITFSATTTTGSQAVNVLANWAYFKNCLLKKVGTGNSSGAAVVVIATGTGTVSRVVFDNTQIQVGNAGDGLRIQGPGFVWKNTASAIQGATLPTQLFFGPSSRGFHAQVEGVDLSALGSGKTLVGDITVPGIITLKDCKLGASVTIASTPSAPGSVETIVSRVDSSGTNYIEQKYSYMGTQIDELTIIRTGGASDGTTAKSRKITTTANAKWIMPFESTPIVIWNDVSGSSVTVTLEGVLNAAALPTNAEVWFDVEYLGASGNPLGSYAAGSKADLLASGANLTASTEAWDSLVTARANSTAYSLGDVRKVASNPGRIFFCTTAGTSAGSEPAGYASAVDGGSVTDNTAVFRAGMRFKQAIAFTPQQKGFIYLYPKAALASTTYYIDPDPALS